MGEAGPGVAAVAAPVEAARGQSSPGSLSAHFTGGERGGERGGELGTAGWPLRVDLARRKAPGFATGSKGEQRLRRPPAPVAELLLGSEQALPWPPSRVLA